MPHIKSVSGYRRPSLAYVASDEEIARKRKAYLTWLARRMGLTTDTIPCSHCHGHGQTAWYSGGRRIQKCDRCAGTGSKALPAPVPDTGRAEEYVRAQEAELDARASQAVEGLKYRLFWRGLRPVIISYGVPHPKTLDEYDARERADDLMRREIDALNQKIRDIKAALEADFARNPDKFLHYANSGDPLPYRDLENEVDALRRKLHDSYTTESLWYVPGTTKIVHVGTNGCGTRRGFRDVPKPTVSIIITPGRAPSSCELDRLVDEALAQLAEPQLIAADPQTKSQIEDHPHEQLPVAPRPRRLPRRARGVGP